MTAQDENTIVIQESRFFDLIETNLWDKISKRLWGIVTAVLSIASILGLIGGWLYIHYSIEKVFLSKAEEFETRTEDILRNAKVFIMIRDKYYHQTTNLQTNIALALSRISNHTLSMDPEVQVPYPPLLLQVANATTYSDFLNDDADELWSIDGAQYQQLQLNAGTPINETNFVDIKFYYESVKIRIAVLAALETELERAWKALIEAGTESDSRLEASRDMEAANDDFSRSLVPELLENLNIILLASNTYSNEANISTADYRDLIRQSLDDLHLDREALDAIAKFNFPVKTEKPVETPNPSAAGEAPPKKT